MPAAGRTSVDVPPTTSSPPGAREMGVPERVSAVPPGVSVVLPRTTAVRAAVRVWPAMVRMVDGGVDGAGGGRRMVDEPTRRVPPPMIRPDGATETGVPDMVASEPMARVLVLMKETEPDGGMEIVVAPMTEGVLTLAGAIGEAIPEKVRPPTTMEVVCPGELVIVAYETGMGLNTESFEVVGPAA